MLPKVLQDFKVALWRPGYEFCRSQGWQTSAEFLTLRSPGGNLLYAESDAELEHIAGAAAGKDEKGGAKDDGRLRSDIERLLSERFAVNPWAALEEDRESSIDGPFTPLDGSAEVRFATAIAYLETHVLHSTVDVYVHPNGQEYFTHVRVDGTRFMAEPASHRWQRFPDDWLLVGAFRHWRGRLPGGQMAFGSNAPLSPKRKPMTTPLSSSPARPHGHSDSLNAPGAALAEDHFGGDLKSATNADSGTYFEIKRAGKLYTVWSTVRKEVVEFYFDEGTGEWLRITPEWLKGGQRRDNELAEQAERDTEVKAMQDDMKEDAEAHGGSDAAQPAPAAQPAGVDAPEDVDAKVESAPIDQHAMQALIEEDQVLRLKIEHQKDAIYELNKSLEKAELRANEDKFKIETLEKKLRIAERHRVVEEETYEADQVAQAGDEAEKSTRAVEAHVDAYRLRVKYLEMELKRKDDVYEADTLELTKQVRELREQLKRSQATGGMVSAPKERQSSGTPTPSKSTLREDPLTISMADRVSAVEREGKPPTDTTKRKQQDQQRLARMTRKREEKLAAADEELFRELQAQQAAQPPPREMRSRGGTRRAAKGPFHKPPSPTLPTPVERAMAQSRKGKKRSEAKPRDILVHPLQMQKSVRRDEAALRRGMSMRSSPRRALLIAEAAYHAQVKTDAPDAECTFFPQVRNPAKRSPYNTDPVALPAEAGGATRRKGGGGIRLSPWELEELQRIRADQRNGNFEPYDPTEDKFDTVSESDYKMYRTLGASDGPPATASQGAGRRSGGAAATTFYPQYVSKAAKRKQHYQRGSGQTTGVGHQVHPPDALMADARPGDAQLHARDPYRSLTPTEMDVTGSETDETDLDLSDEDQFS